VWPDGGRCGGARCVARWRGLRGQSGGWLDRAGGPQKPAQLPKSDRPPRVREAEHDSHARFPKPPARSRAWEVEHLLQDLLNPRTPTPLLPKGRGAPKRPDFPSPERRRRRNKARRRARYRARDPHPAPTDSCRAPKKRGSGGGTEAAMSAEHPTPCPVRSINVTLTILFPPTSRLLVPRCRLVLPEYVVLPSVASRTGPSGPRASSRAYRTSQR
jgi:hypothetical protein